MGYPALSFESALEQHYPFKVAISSGKYYEEIKKELMKYIQEEDILPLTNWDTRIHYNSHRIRYRAWVKEHEQQIVMSGNLLADDRSCKSYQYIFQGLENITADKWLEVSVMAGKGFTPANYFHMPDIFKLSDQEVFLDVGADAGDTVADFISETGGKFKKVIAYEPDHSCYQGLVSNPIISGDSRIVCRRAILSDKTGSIGFDVADNSFLNRPNPNSDYKIPMDTIDTLEEDISLIKIAIKGTDNVMGVLEGGRTLISETGPKLAVLASLTEEDIYTIPEKIHDIRSDYKIYFRLNSYPQEGGQRIAAVYYAVV